MEKRGLGRGLAALIPEATSSTSVREIAITQIAPNPYQPRTAFDPEKLADLVESIRQHGVLQPVLLRPLGGERYQLVAGERRYRAAQKAGLTSIPAVVRECSDKDQLEIAIVENLQREDINAMETARAYRRLNLEFGMTQEQISTRVGKSRSAVANTLRLLQLPEAVLESLERGEITEGHARALLMAEEPSAILAAWKKTVRQQLNVRDTERTAKEARLQINEPTILEPNPKVIAPTVPTIDPNVAALVERLREKLGTKVTMSQQDNGYGKIEIEFYSEVELERLMEILCSS